MATSNYHRINGAAIKAIRCAVPEIEISLDDEVGYYDDPKKARRLKMALGMDKRRICPSDVTASDLCAFAATNLFGDYSREGIGALIYVSQNPDWHQPATACELQERLGLDSACGAFDVNQGCSGYVYGLWLAASLIFAGAADRILLLAGDAHTGGRDLRNRITTPVFGDGGSATLLERHPGASMVFGIGTDGKGFEAIITPVGKARIPVMFDHKLNDEIVEPVMDKDGNPWRLIDTWMDGGAVFDFTMGIVPGHIREMLEYAGNPEIKELVLHQANGHIVSSIALKAGLKNAPFNSFKRFGNLAVASIPAEICETFGSEPPKGNVLMCGYGIGFSWASCLCDASDWDCKKPIIFHADPQRPTRQQRIDRWKRIFKGEEA